MKFIATFHHAFSWRYFEPAYKFDAADPKYAGLYCQPHEPGTPPTQEFLDLWLGKLNEVVIKYQHDLIWFDFGLGSEKRKYITRKPRAIGCRKFLGGLLKSYYRVAA